ncbi:MAG: HAD hydrolase-like protein [Nanoarchaeota archaeon]
MIKLVIFDLDDCLIDKWGATFPVTIKEAIKAMTIKGLRIDSVDDAMRRLSEINSRSKNVPEAISKYLTEIGSYDQKYMEIGRDAIYNFNFDGRIKPLPGVIKMLNELSKLGTDLAVVSKGEEDIQLKNMQMAGIDKNIFKRICIVSDYDKTEPYRKILGELNHSAQETLVVGDRYETDLLPAKNLGAKIAWISWGRGKINPPKEDEVDYSIDNMNRIMDIVKNPSSFQNNSSNHGFEKTKMKNYKVCILAGGIGSRMGDFSKTFNKAMIPVQGKPSICHIIEKFPEDVEMVVVVGYKKETIIDYLVHAYPKRKFVFFEVEKHSGPGAGPGYAVLECKHLLQCPFIFFAADTLIKEEVPEPNENWFGIAEVDDTSRFCSATIDKNNKISKIDDKIKCDNKYAFIGLAGIKDYNVFIDTLEKDKSLIKGEIQVSNGFKGLMEKGMKGVVFTWFDTGDQNSYKHALENYPNGEGYKGE